MNLRTLLSLLTLALFTTSALAHPGAHVPPEDAADAPPAAPLEDPPAQDEPAPEPAPSADTSVAASQQPTPEGDLKWKLFGFTRFTQSGLDDFPIDDQGFTHGQLSRTGAVLELGGELAFRGSRLVTELSVFEGQLAGDESFPGSAADVDTWTHKEFGDELQINEAFLEQNVGIGLLRVGYMEAHWGLGLLANDGQREDDLFHERKGGDYTKRALFITQPLRPFVAGPAGEALVLSLGFDLLERDDLIDTKDGDEATQGVGALIYKQKTWHVGAYGAYRRSERASGDLTEVFVADLYGKWSTPVGGLGTLSVEAELASIQGTTEDLLFEGVDGAVKVQQLGLAARARLEPEGDGLVARLDAGIAPGDNAPQDESLSSIRFDPAYRVGMILFEEILSRTSARSVDGATNPDLVGTPAHGYARIPSQGSIHNALFVAPQVGYRGFNKRLEARVGAMVAVADGGVYDPYQSGLGGGYVTNPYGKADATGLLGTELLAAAVWRQPVFATLKVELGARFAVFLPGEALEAVEGVEGLDTVQKWGVFGGMRW